MNDIISSDGKLNSDLSPKLENISFGEKFAYGLGDFGAYIIFQMVSIFLLFYLTDIYAISAAIVGTLMLVVRALDLIFVPFMGIITDRTTTRWGSYRPFIIFASVPFAVCLFLVFQSPPLVGVTKIIYIFVVYFMLEIIGTVIVIPYTSMIPIMTKDLNHRSQFISARFIGTNVAILLVSSLTPKIISLFTNQKIAFRAISIIYGLVAIIAFVIAFRFIKERYLVEKTQKIKFKDSIKICKNTIPLFSVCAVIFISYLIFVLRLSNSMYYFKYSIGDESLATIFFIIQGLFAIIGLFIGPFLVKKIEKKKTFYLAMGIYVLAGIIWFFAGSFLPIILICGALSSAGLMVSIMVTFAMGADCVEYAEYKTGFRSAGIIGSAQSFVAKIGGTLGMSLVGYVLAWVKYIPDVEQSLLSSNSMIWMMTLLPAFGGILAIAAITFYKLDNKLFLKICLELDERKNKKNLESF
ncbi:MAG: glycoside-pentoside-hexuronide (GPH):cation symporter [Actinomycetota bacterium]